MHFPASSPPSHARLLLASQSPRRRQLLREAGVPHDAEHPGLDDALLLPGAVSARQWVASLALLKAHAAASREVRRAEGPRTILAADTVVVKGDELIGQPADEQDAGRIIALLENGTHEVLTGVALLDPATGERDVFVDAARVSVGPIGAGRIGPYLKSGGWRGKAGAYNLAERLAEGWPIECDGDPGTVMGLPMRRLLPLLRARGLAGAGASPARLGV